MKEEIKVESTIKNKIAWLVAFFGVAVVGSLGATFYHIIMNLNDVNQRVELFDGLEAKVEAVETQFIKQAKDRKNLFLRGHKEKDLNKYQKKITKRTKKMNKILGELEGNGLAKPYGEELGRFKVGLVSLMGIYQAGVDVFQQEGEHTAGDQFVRGKGGKIGEELETVIQRIRSDRKQLHVDAEKDMREFLLYSGGFILLVVLLSSTFLVLGFLGPIKRLLDFTELLKTKAKELRALDLTAGAKIDKASIEQLSVFPVGLFSGKANDEIQFMMKNFKHLFELNSALIFEVQNNAEMEAQLKEAKLVEKQRDETKRVFDTLNQGVLCINKGGEIVDGYSKHSEQIFEQSDLHGKNLISILEKHSNLSSEDISKIRTVVEFSIGDDYLAFEINQDTLPKRAQCRFNASEKSLNLGWQALTDSEEQIDRLLISVQDVTEVLKLSEENEKKDATIKIIGEIAECDKTILLSVLGAKQDIIAYQNELSGEYIDPVSKEIVELKRFLHTLKGNSRSLALSLLSSTVHKTETALNVFLNDEAKRKDGLPRTLLGTIIDCIDVYQDVASSTFGLSHEGRGENVVLQVAKSDFDLIVSKVHSNRIESGIGDLLSLYFKSDTLDSYVEHFGESLAKLGKELSKPAPILDVREGLVLKSSAKNVLEGPLTHILTNSLDHGIESPEERLGQGKSEQGTIFIDYVEEGDLIILRIKDDGGGADIEGLAREGNLGEGYEITQALDCIFTDELTTKGNVSTISGRGVGMASVRSDLEKLGGSILAVPTGNLSANGKCPFQFEIRLDASVLMQS